MSKRSFFDKVANAFGYYKNLAMNISSLFSLDEGPAKKMRDYIGAYTSWVYACVNARARDVSGIDLHLFRTVNRKTGEAEEIQEHEVLSLLRSVNNFTTFRDLIFATQSYRDLAGEAFWWIVKNGPEGKQKNTQIWILRPDYVKVLTDSRSFVVGYKYQVSGGEEVTFQPDEIIHFKNFNPTNPYRGLSVIQAAAVTLDADDYAERYNRKFFQNSAIPSTVLSTEQKLTDAQVKRMHEQWKAQYGGTDKAGKMAILEGGLKLQPFVISQKDMEFLGGLAFTRDKILALFQVPKTVLGMTEGVTVSNAEATDLVFAKRVVKPLMEDIKDYLNEFLIPQYQDGDDLFFDITDPVPENTEMKMRRYETLTKVGAMSPNEVRSEEGMDEVPGLDAFYISSLSVPIGIESEDEEGEQETKIVRHQKPKYRHMRVPAKTIKRHITDEVINEVRDAVLGEITKHLKHDPASGVEDQQIQGIRFPEEKKEAFWKAIVAKSEAIESEFAKRLRAYFNRQEREMIERLEEVEKRSMKVTGRDLEKVLFLLSSENKIAISVLVPVLMQALEEGGEEALDALDIGAVGFDMTTEAVAAFRTSEALKGIKAMNKFTKQQVRQVLSEGVREGKSIPEMARGIRNVFEVADKVRSLRIARTEVLKASNKGALEAYSQSGVVAAKEWFTALDERVCEWCGPMQGVTTSLDNDFFDQGSSFTGNKGGVIRFNLSDVETPPLHPNCRCVLVPVTITGERRAPQPRKKGDYGIDIADLTESITKRVVDEVVPIVRDEMKKELDDAIEKI